MKPLELDGVTIVTSTPACDNCGKAAVALVTFARLDGAGLVTLCGRCASDLLPAAPQAEAAPARRPGRKRTRQAGG